MASGCELDVEILRGLFAPREQGMRVIGQDDESLPIGTDSLDKIEPSVRRVDIGQGSGPPSY
jgi:hypothetical protein